MKKALLIIFTLISGLNITAQINTDRVMIIGRNALYYEDYVLAIQYFNQVINAKPYLADPYYYRAIAKYYLDDMKGAEDDCTLALNRNSFMTKTYQLRADSRQGQEKRDEALEDYKMVLQTMPNDRFSLINTGIVYIQLKEFEKAEEALELLTASHPKFTHSYLIKGILNTERGDTIKAFENFNYAITLDKYLSQSYSMRGMLYYATQEYDSALVDLNEAVSLDPLLMSNYINRGLIKYSKNDLRGAMADYDQVISKESSNIIARFNRGLLRAQVGDNNNAIEDINTVLRHEPENYMALYNRALLHSSISNHKAAIEDINEVINKYPDYFGAYYARAQIKREGNDMRGAERDYNIGKNLEANALTTKKDDKDKTREKSDDDLDKFNLLVVADKEEVDKSKYENEKRGKIQNRTVNIEVEQRFILSYYEKPDDIRRKVYFSPLIEEINHSGFMPKAIKLTNDEAPLNALQVEEHFNSINILSGKIARDTLNATLYFARAIDFMLVQDFLSSIEDLERAIQIEPNFTLAYFNRAVVYSKQLELKDFSLETEEAKSTSLTNMTDLTRSKSAAEAWRIEYDMIMRNYNKVIELNPDFAYAYYNRATVKYIQGDYRGAILDYNEAIKQNSNFHEAFFNRGLSRFQIRDKDKALDDMRKAGEGGIVSAYGIIKRMTE